VPTLKTRTQENMPAVFAGVFVLGFSIAAETNYGALI
jgi:hypothetical protein